MWRVRGWCRALLALFLARGSADPAAVTVRPVPLCSAAAPAGCPPPRAQAAGLLRFSGGLLLESSRADFGGLSALRVGAPAPAAGPIAAADAAALPFVAVSDDAVLVTGRLEHDGSGWLTGVAGVALAPLRGLDGHALSERDAETGLSLRDAESLASTSDADPLGGDLLVGFERLHRVWRYPVGGALGGAAGAAAAVPVEQRGLGAHNARISGCAENGGVEAMDFLHSGALLVFCEDPLPSEGAGGGGEQFFPGWLLPSPADTDTALPVRLASSFPQRPERPVAVARIPRLEGGRGWGQGVGERVLGGILVLQRSYTRRAGNVLRVLFLDANTLASAAAAGARARARL